MIPLSQITQCTLDIDEDRDEIFMKDAQGNDVSYNPKRYTYSYDFELKIRVNNRWFDEITVKLNDSEVEGMGTAAYHRYEQMGNQLCAVLTGATQATYAQQSGYARRPQQTMPLNTPQNQSGIGQMGFAAQTANAAQPAQMQSDRWFCPNCGTPNSSKFCSNCGTPRP